jgi:hypothetical protein
LYVFIQEKNMLEMKLSFVPEALESGNVYVGVTMMARGERGERHSEQI